VAGVYNLREVAALFLEERNLVHAEHIVSKLAYISDIIRSSVLWTHVYNEMILTSS
jgi:hypothetical protein